MTTNVRHTVSAAALHGSVEMTARQLRSMLTRRLRDVLPIHVSVEQNALTLFTNVSCVRALLEWHPIVDFTVNHSMNVTNMHERLQDVEVVLSEHTAQQLWRVVPCAKRVQFHFVKGSPGVLWCVLHHPRRQDVLVQLPCLHIDETVPINTATPTYSESPVVW